MNVLPRSNPPALERSSRLGPDGENLARSFPGRDRGGLTERIAATVAPLIEDADLLIDLHSAGRNYLMPPLVGISCQHVLGGRSLREAALATPMPFVWVHPSIGPGRSISLADAHGTPWVYFESGCGGALTRHDIDRYVESVMVLLVAANIVVSPTANIRPPVDRVVVVDGDGNTDAGIVSIAAGRFVRSVEVGQAVRADQEIGALHDDDGHRIATVTSRDAGRVMMLRHEQRVRIDDVLAIVAGEEAAGAP